MQTVQVAAELSSDELLRAVEQPNPPELEQFVSRVIFLQAQRRAPVLPQAEAELLATINEGLTADQWARYDVLKGKRDAETLGPAEHEELLALSDHLEATQARRIGALAEPAHLRRTTLGDVMRQLGIRPRHACRRGGATGTRSSG